MICAQQRSCADALASTGASAQDRGARLILLNGPPGAGKSVLARRYADAHALTAALDIDDIRGMLGGWRTNLHAAGLAARAMTLAMARTHLGAGHDVIVAQFLARPDFIVTLDELAADVGVEFVEIVLLADLDESVRRYQLRGGDEDPEALQQMYARLVGCLRHRPRTHVVDSVTGEVDAAYLALSALLDG